MRGTYIVTCYGRSGALRWQRRVENLITTLGRNALLDLALSGNVQAGRNRYIGLISSASYASAPVVDDSMSSHSGWTEAGVANAPTFAARAAITFGAAQNGSATSSEGRIDFTGDGTVKGLLLVFATGAASTPGDTGGVLLSAVLFGSDLDVVVGERLSIIYVIGPVAIPTTEHPTVGGLVLSTGARIVGSAAGPSETPPPVEWPVEDSWQRVDPGGSNPPLGSDGPAGWYWARAAISDLASGTGAGKILMSWGHASGGGGSFLFDTTTIDSTGYGSWTCTSSGGSGIPYDLSNRENYDMTFDPDQNRFWITSGTSSPDHPEVDRCIYFDPTTNLYAFYDNLSFISHGGSAGVYFNGYIYQWAKWGETYSNLYRFSTSSISGGYLEAIGSGPQVWTQETPYGASKASQWRSGIDRRTGQIWSLADDQELWIYDLRGAQRWVKIPTFGTKPNGFCMAVLHEGLNCIAAWTSGNGLVGSDLTTQIGETKILDLSTLTWRAGPTYPSQSVPPRNCVVAAQGMLYDRRRKKVLLLQTVGGNHTEVWQLNIAGSQL